MPRLKNEMRHNGKRVYIHILQAFYGCCLTNGDERKPKLGKWMRARMDGHSITLDDVQPCCCGMHASDTLSHAKRYTGGLSVRDTVCLVELRGNIQEHTTWIDSKYVVDKYAALDRKIISMRAIKNEKEKAWLIKNAKNNTKIRKWILKQYK